MASSSNSRIPCVQCGISYQMTINSAEWLDHVTVSCPALNLARSSSPALANSDSPNSISSRRKRNVTDLEEDEDEDVENEPDALIRERNEQCFGKLLN